MEKQILKMQVIDVDVVFAGSGKFNYRLTFDKAFDAIVKSDDGQFAVSKVNYIDFHPQVLLDSVGKTRQFKTKLNAIKAYCIKTGLSIHDEMVEHLSNFMFDKMVEIDRTPYKAGDAYVDYDGNRQIYQYDGFKKDIISIE